MLVPKLPTRIYPMITEKGTLLPSLKLKISTEVHNPQHYTMSHNRFCAKLNKVNTAYTHGPMYYNITYAKCVSLRGSISKFGADKDKLF